MKKLIIVISCLISLSVPIYLALVDRHYVSTTITNNVELAYHDGEAFIKIGERIHSTHGSMIGTMIKSLMLFVSNNDQVSERTLIFHIQSGSLENYTLKDFSPGGSLFPFQHSLYYTIGVEKASQWPALWKWTGRSFEKIEHNDAVKIMRSFSLLDDVYARERWQNQQPPFRAGIVNVEFSLNGRPYHLILRQDESKTSVRRAVILQTPDTTEPRVLADGDDSYRRLDE